MRLGNTWSYSQVYRHCTAVTGGLSTGGASDRHKIRKCDTHPHAVADFIRMSYRQTFRDRLPKVHGVKKSKKNPTARTDGQGIGGSKGFSDVEACILETREIQLMPDKMRGCKLKLLQLVAFGSVVYLVYRLSDSAGLLRSYTNQEKVQAVLPDSINVIAAKDKPHAGRPLQDFRDDFAGLNFKEDKIVQAGKKGVDKNEIRRQSVLNSKNELRSVACVPLKSTENKVKICIHNPTLDKVISQSLLTTGSWDDETVADFKRALETDRGLGVIDLGANLGTYSLLAAHMGRDVLAVDACHVTVKHLQRSVDLNNFGDRITIVEAAVMPSRGYARVVVPEGDYGSAYPTLVSPNDISKVDVETHRVIKAVKLEDLVEYVTFPRLILKIDINGEDYGILQEAKRLFDVRDVRYVFMVFSPDKGSREGKTQGVHFLQSRGYEMKKFAHDKEHLFALGLNNKERPSHLVWVKTNP